MIQETKKADTERKARGEELQVALQAQGFLFFFPYEQGGGKFFTCILSLPGPRDLSKEENPVIHFPTLQRGGKEHILLIGNLG